MHKEEKSNELIIQWLKKLEQESWQLELLVSGFTIFLLISASLEFDSFVSDLWFKLSFSDNVLGAILTFMSLLNTGIICLIFFLVLHLILRGFWIGAIGLRSVQPDIDFSKLGYSTFFTKKLKERVIGLDRLIILLDEVCSVIFSVAFLIISMIISLGMWVVFMGFFGFTFSYLISISSGGLETFITIISGIIGVLLVFTGIVYLIDYFTLGFFKKYEKLSRLFFPIYQFYGAITLSIISKSIYYYLISRYPKKRVRLIGFVLTLCTLLYYSFDFDQYQYFPESVNEFSLYNNHYEDLRVKNMHVVTASIQSRIIKDDFLELFISYKPDDNKLIKSNCPDFEPLKKDGINSKIKLKFRNRNLLITGENFNEEDKEQLKKCLSSLYEVSINDSTYTNLNFYFYTHPQKKQKGIMTLIPTKGFMKGENRIKISKTHHSTPDSSLITEDLTSIPFWLE